MRANESWVVALTIASAAAWNATAAGTQIDFEVRQLAADGKLECDGIASAQTL